MRLRSQPHVMVIRRILMEKTFDVVALGELLIDFTQNSVSPAGNPVFEANPGGAPANVLAMLRQFSKKCAFIGKVGNDSFGDLLENVLNSKGIDISGLLRDPSVPTTLAFIHNKPDGDRDFSFYRSPGADIMLRKEDLPEGLLSECRIFHFGSLSLTNEPSRTATYHAVSISKGSEAIISYDPNLRPALWNDLSEAREMIRWGLSVSDIVKISDNEAEFVTGSDDPDTGAALILKSFPNIKLLLITAGTNGSYAYYQGITVHEPAYLLGGTVDTTGAGDIFCASVLSYILEHDISHLIEQDFKNMLSLANAAAYLITTRRGVINSVPDIREIKQVISHEIID